MDHFVYITCLLQCMCVYIYCIKVTIVCKLLCASQAWNYMEAMLSVAPGLVLCALLKELSTFCSTQNTNVHRFSFKLTRFKGKVHY